MSEYKALLEKKRELEAQIEAARKAELSGAIEKVRAIVAEFGLSAADVFHGGRAAKVPSIVAPKYRDPATGQTWTGRGKPPKWIADKERTQFAI
ncbi:histone (plasmid) [Acidovorax carolinensis]|uniref:Histone n=1 Tax=Acidovorax carolinensis TaxID=553814 RepID=A0A240UIW3_9BURK|nr:H-NS histone family protein [Acidovorax carolinensis]ART61444.1 histone [Acidovorax carolinensis]